MYNNLDDHPLSPENTEIDYPRDNDDDQDNEDYLESDNADMVDDDFLQTELSQ